jgi:hypothetical protein
MSWARLLVLLLGAAGVRPALAQSLDPTPAPLGPRPGWRFLPSAAFTYDSFGQRYVVADEDTLDLVDEFGGRLMTTLEHVGRTQVQIRNTFGMGQEATRNDLQLRAQRGFGRLDLRLDNELRFKAYQPGSEYVLSSDYRIGSVRATATWTPGGGLRARLHQRYERADFVRRTRYNYDYSLLDLGLDVERSWGFLSNALGSYTWGRRVVPDSSAIDYTRHLILADWDQDVGPHGLRLDQRLERRLYGDPTVRSHFWDWEGGLGLRLAAHPKIRLRPAYRAALMRFDAPDSLDSNASEQSLELLVEGDVSERTVLAVGPRGEFRRTTSDIDRAYNQWGLVGTLSFLAGTRFWIQFSEEIGSRRHLAGDETFYTDYLFNWTTLYLSWEPLRRLTLDVFFSLNPENHTDSTDDSTTLLLSTSVTYGLR